MSDLREKIAEQIYRAYYSTKPRPPLTQDILMAAHKTFNPADPSDRAWLATADECIRQMEWARRECAECPYQDAELDMLELTLAPDDWRPDDSHS